MVTFKEYLIEFDAYDEMQSHHAEREADSARQSAQERFENAVEAALERVEGLGEHPEEVAAFISNEYKVDEYSLLDAIENTINRNR